MELSLDQVMFLLEDGQTEAALQMALQIHAANPDDALANYHCAIAYDTSSQEQVDYRVSDWGLFSITLARSLRKAAASAP